MAKFGNSVIIKLCSRLNFLPAVIFISFGLSRYASRIVEAIQSQNLDNGDYVILLYATTPGIFSFAFSDSNTTMHLLDALKSIIVFSPETLADTNTQDYNNFLHQVLNRSSNSPLNFSLPDGVLVSEFKMWTNIILVMINNYCQ